MARRPIWLSGLEQMFQETSLWDVEVGTVARFTCRGKGVSRKQDRKARNGANLGQHDCGTAAIQETYTYRTMPHAVVDGEQPSSHYRVGDIYHPRPAHGLYIYPRMNRSAQRARGEGKSSNQGTLQLAEEQSKPRIERR